MFKRISLYLNGTGIDFGSRGYDKADYPTAESAANDPAMQYLVLEEIAYNGILSRLRVHLTNAETPRAITNFLQNITRQSAWEEANAEERIVHKYLVDFTIYTLLRQYPNVMDAIKESIAKAWREAFIDESGKDEDTSEDTRPRWTADYLNQVIDNGGAVYVATRARKTLFRRRGEEVDNLDYFKADSRGNVLVLSRYKSGRPQYDAITSSGGKVFMVEIGVYPTPEDADDVEIQLFGKLKKKKTQPKKTTNEEKDIELFETNLRESPHNTDLLRYNEEKKQHEITPAISLNDRLYWVAIQKTSSDPPRYVLNLQPTDADKWNYSRSTSWEYAKKDLKKTRPDLFIELDHHEKHRGRLTEESLSKYVADLTPMHREFSTQESSERTARRYIQNYLSKDGEFTPILDEDLSDSIALILYKLHQNYKYKTKNKKRHDVKFYISQMWGQLAIWSSLIRSRKNPYDEISSFTLSPTMTVREIVEKITDSLKKAWDMLKQKEEKEKRDRQEAEKRASESRRRYTSPFEKW